MMYSGVKIDIGRCKRSLKERWLWDGKDTGIFLKIIQKKIKKYQTRYFETYLSK